MKSGELKHRGSVQHNVAAQDELGSFGPPDWREVTKRWMKIEPIVGRELMAALAEKSGVTHRISMRYYAGLDVKHRIVHAGVIYEFVDVKHIDMNYKKTEVQARTGVSNG